MTTSNTIPAEHGNLARNIIHAILWAALIVAPGLLGVLATFFVVRAFSFGFLPGLRSFAAVLLPLMVLTFVVAPKLVRQPHSVILVGVS